MSYQELRNAAIKMNKEEGSRHPCVRGKDECCEPNILISIQDADLIKRNVKNGNIPLPVIQDAVNRLSDDSHWYPR